MIKPFNEWTGPYFDSNARFAYHDSCNPILVDNDSCSILESIFEKLQIFENMASYKDEERFIFYFRLPRGTAEQYMSYEDMLEGGYSFKNKDEYHQLFNKWYPRKWYWFSAYFHRSFYNGDTYYFIMLGGKVYLYAYDGKGGRSDENDYASPYAKLVEPLVNFVDYLVKFASAPNYTSFVNKHLDYRLRTGSVPYKEYWKLFPQDKKKYMKYYEGINPKDFINYYKEGIINRENATRFEKLTANKYCLLFKIATDAVGLSYNEEKTPQENFHKNSDGRNHGLNEIEPDSTEVFDEWYKNESYHFDHTFEMRVHYGRVDLIVDKDDKGYYLRINGNSDVDSAYMMKIYLAFKKRNIDTYIYDPKCLIDDYLGNSLYFARSYEKYLGNFPKKKIKEYIKMINWDEPEIIKLKT